MGIILGTLALLGLASFLAFAVMWDTMTPSDRRKAGFKD
jgi:hypothetical protein